MMQDDPWQAEAAKMKQQPGQQGSGAPAAKDPWSAGSAPEPNPDGGAPTNALQRFFGRNPVSDIAGTAWDHLKNVVAAPLHALGDPVEPEEAPLAQFGPGAVAAYRMFAKPTVEGLKTFNTQRKAGNTSMTAPEYDGNGNYTPTAASGLMDAVPVVGPWARGMENDAHQHGALAALVGLGVDLAAPKYIAKGTGAAMSRMAPPLAEHAVGIKGMDRAHGATPGRAILDETSGFTPERIEETGRDSLRKLQDEQADMLHDAHGPVTLTPARNVGIGFANKAIEENHPGTIKDLGKLNDQLITDYSTAEPMPEHVSASKAAALNRGISNAKTSWNPATANDTMNASAGTMHHELGNSIADVVPEIKPLNQRVQSLMPVIRRSVALQQNEGLLGRTLSRIGARTGALTLGAAGWHEFGPLGAAAGVIAPELIGDPVFKMGLARGMDAAGKGLKNIGPALPAAGPLFMGARSPQVKN